MTDATVEGGLDEPAELEPEQGSLALASPEDPHGRADWEAAAAAVLRKARRLTDEDADALVWEKLTRTTLDGIGVTPLGTPDLLDGLQTAGRPTRTGDWDIRAHLGVADAKAAQRGGARPTSRTASPRSGCEARAGRRPGPPCSTASSSTSRPSCSTRPPTRWPRRRRSSPTPSDSDAAPGHQPRASPPAQASAEAAGARPRRRRARRSSSTRPRCTTGAPPTSRSSRYSMGSRRRTCGRSPTPGSTLDEAAALVEFRYAATDEQFPTIAKLRAARRLWARVLELSGAARASSSASTRSPAGR